MSTNTGIIKIALKMKDDGTIKVLKTTGAESEKTGKKGTKAFKEMDKSSRSFTKGAKGASTAMMKMAAGAVSILGLAAAWNKLKAATKEYISLANIQEDAETDLEAVLRSTGYAAGYNITQLKLMASAMQDVTRTGDETILSGMSILATFKQVRGEAFERASMAALDMSRIMKQDLKSSMIQVGKALNDPVVGLTALSRIGVTFSENQKKVIRALQETGDIAGAQSIILAELESQFGGSAAASASIFAGRVDQASNALGDAKEEMGYVITKNKFFIELTRLATTEFKHWGMQTSKNRDYLMALARDGVLKVVDALGLGIETLRFFHNGWLGIKLVGNTAIHGLAIAMDELWKVERKILKPLDLIFEGLVKLGKIDSNPFDKISQGFEDFRWSSGDVTKDVLNDIDKTNQRYDSISSTLLRWKKNISELPSGHIEANNQIRTNTKSTYDDLSAMAAQYADKAKEDKRKQANQSFLNDFKRVTMTSFDFERDQLKARYEHYNKFITDKIALLQWYGLENKRITDEETQARLEAEKQLREANKTTFGHMADAAKNWSGTLASKLNDLVWQADTSFGDILASFGKMLTEMIIKKQAAEPLMEFASIGIQSMGSWLFNANGNAFGKSGHVQAYAHGSVFTNKIVDKPTMFAHGGGLGIMGEKSPEVIAPLFRGSDGDMGVKAKISAAPVIINVIDQRTGDSPNVEVSETQGPDGRTQIRILIREEMKGAMADGSMDKSMRTNYGLQRAGIRR